MKKRGRPKKEVAKNDQYRLRMSAEERLMLNELTIETGLPISEILRKALKIYYNMSVRHH